MSITSILGHLKTVCPCGLDMLIFFMSITRSLGMGHNHIQRDTGDPLTREEVQYLAQQSDTQSFNNKQPRTDSNFTPNLAPTLTL